MSRKLGIIGGLSAESTASYYLYINRTFYSRAGEYPEVIIYSVNLESYHRWREEDRWDLIINDLVFAANNLKKAGAKIGLIATNTMHKVFNEVQSKTSLPLLNVIDATAAQIKQRGFSRVGLLGTRFTMSEDFYVKGLQKEGIQVVVPSQADQQLIHDIIINELVRGVILPQSKSIYLKVISTLVSLGAEAVILGCTEIPLLLPEGCCDIPLLDTARVHADFALNAIGAE